MKNLNKYLLLFFLFSIWNTGCDIMEDDVTPTNDKKIEFDTHPAGKFPNAAAAYASSDCKWDVCSVSYYIDNYSDQLSSLKQKNMFEQVLETWTDASGIQFNKANTKNQANIVFSFEEVDGAGNRLAYTFFPCDANDSRAGNVIIDKDESWSLDASNNSSAPYDLFTVVLHEVGHALGLDHSSEESALMFANYSGSHRQLDNDDILGINHIYQCNSSTGGGTGGGSCGNNNINLELGLVGYFPFNGNTYDASGNGNTGIAYNAWLTTDRYAQSNQAYHFNGYSNSDNPSRISVQSCPGIVLGESFSFAGWIKMDGNSGMNSSGQKATYNVIHTIFAKDFYKGNAISASILGYNNQKYLRFSSPYNTNQVKIDIINGIWTHIAITYDNSTKKISTYVNGLLVSCENTNHNITSSNGQRLIIGSCKKGFGGNNNSFRYWYPFYGSLDELRFYNRVLNNAEVSKLSQM